MKSGAVGGAQTVSRVRGFVSKERLSVAFVLQTISID